MNKHFFNYGSTDGIRQYMQWRESAAKAESNSCVDPKKYSTVPHTAIEQYWYKGTMIDVDIEYTVCDACGFEFVDTDQIRRNEHTVREAKEERDRFIRIMKGNT